MSGVWDEHAAPPAPGTAVAFADAVHGLIVGAGAIATTVDSGEHWELRSAGTAAPLYDVATVGPGHALAVGEGGTVVATHDGGATFHALSLFRTLDLRTNRSGGIQARWFAQEVNVRARRLSQSR
jgi:photosystem II stability/assembly factor-like uncharacterized protein